jgi:hypothetical protein
MTSRNSTGAVRECDVGGGLRFVLVLHGVLKSYERWKEVTLNYVQYVISDAAVRLK